MTEFHAKIAIVGMAGRFPGAPDIDTLWQSLVQGTELIERFDDAELIEAGIDRRHLLNPSYVRARPLLDNVSMFDAAFFGMTAREAELTDPQLRILMECGWEALDESGYADRAYDGTIGVFAGVRLSRYLDEHLLADAKVIESAGRDYLLMVNRKDSAATLLAYRLDLTGPAISVNTACSTSLVAVHLAATALLNFECDVALAGGSAIPAFGKEGYVAPPDSPWSPDGHCRAFDMAARGTLDGAGAGMVALRRLEDAVAAGDVIHAVILGSAVNNDGAAKVGYAAPSIAGQARVIAEAMTVAGLSGDEIGYVEAHGTATPLGDPIEIAALTKAYRRSSQRVGDCPIGSMKSNIGHLGAAAGVAGLIKAALCLERERIPASLHFEVPNAAIDFPNSPFFVNDRLRSWPRGPERRRAAVSSFGIGGTNAHVILEEAPDVPASFSHRRFHVLPVSARSEAARNNALRRLADHLEQQPLLPVADLSATLRKRAAFASRTAVVAGDSATAVESLRRSVEAPPPRGSTGKAHRVAFLFSGQGAQRIGMMEQIYYHEPIFREGFARCARHLRYAHGIDLEDLIWPSRRDAAAKERLDRTEHAQPALFAVGWALAEFWESFGIEPAAMCGHSIGEYVAACRAGVFDLEQALSVVVMRARAMQQAPGGRMLAVAAGESVVAPWLGQGVDLAAINGDTSCVLAGSADAIDRVRRRCETHDVSCRLLSTSHAFHSRLMEPVLDDFRRALEGIRPADPRIPFVSSTTGDWITATQATDLEYWVRQIREPVRFAAGVGQLAKQASVMLELGPDATLSNLVRSRAGVAAAVPSCDPRSGLPDDGAILAALGRLWELGIQVDWERFGRGENLRRVVLPPYPFERSVHWIDPPRGAPRVGAEAGAGAGSISGGDKPSAAARALMENMGDSGDSPVAVVLDGDTDADVLASAQRSADAAGIPLVLLTSRRPDSEPGTLLLDPPAPAPQLDDVYGAIKAAAKLGYRRIILNMAGWPSRAEDGHGPLDAGQRPAGADAAPATPEGEMCREISSILGTALGLPQVRPHDNFFDIGGDSLLALQVIGQINKTFGSSIRPAEIIASPTASALAAQVERSLLEAIGDDELDSVLVELGSVGPSKTS